MSANLTSVATGATAVGGAQSNHVIHEVVASETAGAADSLSYQPGGAAGDMFAGMGSQVVTANSANATTPTDAPHASATASDASGQVLATAPAAQNPAANPASTETGAAAVQQSSAAYTVAPAAAATMGTSAADTLAMTSVDHPGAKALEMTTTLKGANGPPQSSALTLQDLHDYISDLLASASASFTSHEVLGSVSLGGFLQLDGVVLDVNATLSGGTWSGSVTISATGATLFPGKNFNGTIAATSGNAISGTYTIGAGYSLALTNSANLVINVGEALKISAAGVTINYSPDGAENQTVATITTGSVTSRQFTGMPSATLTNFVLRGDGFSFGAFSVTSASSSTPAIGNLLTATSATLSVTNFNVSFGTSTTSASLSGTVSLTLSGLKLFPTGSIVDFEATAVTAAYDFGTTFDGTTPTGTLSLTISGFKLKLGEAMNLTATGDVVLTPGQATMATIASATLSSPQFTGLGTFSVSNVVVRQDGFSLGSLEWSKTGTIGISDIITADSVTVTLSNFSLSYGTIPSFTGGISVSATNVVLFGGIPILNLHLGNISGLYDFGDISLPTLPRLKLHIPDFDIPLGDFLTIHLGTIDLTPGFLSMIKLPHVDLIPNLFAGLPHIDLPDFELTQLGFSLGTFSFTIPTAINIGNFISLPNLTINVTNFSISKVSPFVTGVVTVTFGDLTLFPGSNIVTSSFTNLRGVFDFSVNAVVPGRFQFFADSATLGFGGQLTITANNIAITPALDTIATIGSATASFPLLEGFQMSLSNLAIRRDGFTIASASATINTLNLGGILSLTSPTVTLTDVSYAAGGSLSGTVGFSTSSAKLSLESALETSASSLSGSYNLATGHLSVTLSSFGLNLAGFASINATGASISYDPTTGGASEILVGVTGVEAFLGTGTGDNRVGVELTSGSLALALYKASNGTKTYALEAKGTVALLGMPADTLSLSGTVSFRKSTVTTAVDETISVNGTDLHLVFAATEESAMGSNIHLGVGTFVSIDGDFSFRQFSPDSGTTNYIVVGVTSLDATVAAGNVSLSVTGASLGLLLKAGATPAASGYALVVNGGTDSLNGVPDLSLTASGLSVRVRHGFDPGAVSGLPASITTPSGSVNMSFAGISGGTGDITDVQGHITLAIANFVSITGDFGFQQFTTGGTTYMAVGVKAASIVLGTGTQNVTVSGGTLGLILAPGVNGGATSYALQASGSVALNGVTGLTLSGNNLSVRARKGLDLAGKTVPSTIQTSAGDVTLNFAGLPAGSSEVFDIEGHLTLSVDGFGSLVGDFGVQSFTNGGNGQQTIAIGVTGATIKLGTDDVNLTVTGATFGAIIRPGLNAAPATYALQATATSVALNGIDGLTANGSNISVRIRSGLDLATLTGIPTTIQTGATTSTTLNFSGLPAGSSDVMDVQGHITLGIGTFVSLVGDFGFQSYAVGNDHYLAIGATNLTATLSAGPVNLTIANASVGVMIKQGTAASQGNPATPATYALIAKGSSNPNDTTLTGGPAFTLSASNLLVRVRSGLDVTALPSSLPHAVHTTGGDVTFDFSGLGSGTSDVTDIQGHLTLGIANFVSLEGDFGFQKFGSGADAALAIGAKNLKAVLGSPTGVNLTITGASLGVVVKGSGYAIYSAAGSIALNGIQDVSVTSTSLKVRAKSGLDLSTVTVPASVLVAGNQTVNLDFTGLPAGDVTEISGSASVDFAGFVSLSGTFSFRQDTTSTRTKILVGGSGITAFVGSPDKSFGVQINSASFGLVIYRDATATASTYALQASSSDLQVFGLGVGLSGAINVAVNTTGAAVNETIIGGTDVVFADGTAIKSIGGSLQITIGTFTLAGDFSFSQTTALGGGTTLKIGVANVHTLTGGHVTSDSGLDYALTDGTLGYVSYSTGGYVLVASATATLTTDLGGATATLTIRKNTTTASHTENVLVGATTIPLVFTSAAETVANYSKIVISNAAFTIGNPTVIKISAGQIDPATVNGNASTTSLSQVTMTLYIGSQVLLNITAGTADYTTFTGTGTTTLHGRAYSAGDTDVYLSNVSLSIGNYVTFTAGTINLQSYTVAGATTHAFAFGNAAITFLVSGKPMVTIGGTINFHFNQTDGFKLDSISSPIISFLGQQLVGAPSGGSTAGLTTGPEGTSYQLADAPPPTVITLGPISITNPGITFDNFQFNSAGGTNVTVSTTVHLTAAQAKIGADSSPLHATVTGLNVAFDLGVTFNPLSLSTPPTASSNHFTVTASSFSITLGSFLTISATSFTIDPTASASQDFVSFGSLTATLTAGSFSVGGTANNFAIEGDGSFLAKANFAVTLTLGDGAESGMNWPSWLPLKSLQVGLHWADFNAHPTQFLIQLSAEVDASIGTINLSGSVRNAVIDPNLIAQGKFPVISVDSVAIGASGNLFGGTISGSLVVGVVRFDANGATIDGLGNIQGTVTPATGAITNVFYGGLTADFSFAGTAGFGIRLGISELGPLQIYIEAKVPVALGPTGLFISNFRGGVTFGQSFPTLTLSDPIAAGDALQLRKPGFSTPSALTLGQWETGLRNSVITLYQGNPVIPSNPFANLSNTPILITAGATLYAANENAFRVDADMIFDTSGRFLVIGSATIGNSLSIGVKMFADLSQPASSVKLLYLMEVPAQTTPTPTLPPIYSVYGVATFSFTGGVFSISLAGAVDFNVLGGLRAHAEATVTLTFAANSFNLTLSNASFSIPTISTSPLGTAAGSVTIETSGGTTNIWGGFLLNTDLTPLRNMGIDVTGQVFVKLNTTNVEKSVSLLIGGGTTVLSLKATSFSLMITGGAKFSVGGQQVFEIPNATLAVDINATSLTIFVVATLRMGPNSSTTILTFNASGLIYVQMTEDNGMHPGFAAKLTLTMSASLPSVQFNMNWLLVTNTTGGEITYFIPSAVPGGPTVATVVGPDYGSSNPNATVSYETTVNGKRALVIPAGPPGTGLANYSTWTPTSSTPYLVVIGRGNLTVANSFFFTGAIAIRAANGNFTLDTNATLQLKANGNTVFTFDTKGNIQINSSGIAAAFTVSLNGGVPSNMGFSFTGGVNLSFQLQLNTTGSQVTIGGTTISAGSNNFYGNIHIFGNLSFLGGVATLNGSFDLTVTGSSLSLAINANITFLNATLHAEGTAGIYYDSSPGLSFSITLSLPGGAQGIAPVAAIGSNFVIKGTFTLQINTTGLTRAGVAPGFRVSISNIGVYLFGFNLTGSLSISITSAGFNIDIQNLTLNLFGFATVTLSGYVHSDGQFRFTGTASFQLGDHTFGIGGSITVTISNSGFSASISGWVAAFGVEISGGGAVTISGSSVDVDVWISVVVIPAVNIDTPDIDIDLGWFGSYTIPGIHIHTPAVVVSGTAHFHLGSTAPAPAPAAVIPPAPPPSAAPIAGFNGSTNQLVLYLGADVANRNAAFGAQAAENYTLTLSGAGTNGTQNITVSALGVTTTFNNVGSILVRDTQTGNDTIQIDSAITVPVNITLGNGSNTINTGSGPATVSIAGSTTGSVVTTGASSSITVSGGGGNNISTGSNSSINISGGGANRVTVNGNTAGTNNVTISGNGANLITVIGTTSTNMTVTGAGANLLTVGAGGGMINLRGAGANQVTTGTGSVTINDQGTGGTTVKAGSGGGTFITGRDVNGVAFASKGVSSVTTTTGNFSVQAFGFSSYTLGDTQLRYGSFTLTLVGVRTVFLTAASTTAANSFVLTNWTGAATLTGAGTNNSLNYSAASSATTLNYTLANGSLGVTGSVTQTITLSNIQKGNLIGTTTGTTTFNVTGWTGTGAMVGASGATNTLVATNDVATFSLDDTKFTRTGAGDIAISNVQNATITGGASANTFLVSSWTGTANLDGVGGGDTYTLSPAGTGTGTVNVTDTGTAGTDVLNINAPRTVFITLNQVRVGTQRTNYSGIETLAVTGTASALTFNVQSTKTGTSTSIATGSSSAVVNIGSNAGVIPAAAGTLNGIAGALSISGGGTMFLDDTGILSGTRSGTLTATTISGFGMGGTITYTGESALTANLGAAAYTVAVNEITSSTLTTINAGASTNDTVNATFATDFNGTLNLTGFEHGTVSVGNNFNGILNVTAPGHLETVAIGSLTNHTGSLTLSGRLNAGGIDTLTIGSDLAGQVNVSGVLASLTVGRDLSGSVTETGTISLLAIGHDLTTSGTINATGSITTMTVGHDLIGHLTVSANVTSLSVTGNLSGTVSVGGALTNLAVTGNVSGSVTESGTINLLTIGGTFSGNISASNAGDPAQVPAGTYSPSGNIVTMTVGGLFSGALTVTGNLGSLTIGTPSANANLTGTVTVHGALTNLTVNGDLAGTGTVTETGAVNLIKITGSLGLTALINVSNTADPGAQRASVTEIAVTLDIVGTIFVSGRLAKLTVGRDITTTGLVTESGTISELTVGRNLAGTIKAQNSVTAGTANITTLTVGGNVSGLVTVTGSLTTATVSGNVSGTITVQDTLGTLKATGDISGTVTESGVITLLTIGGNLTSTGTINAINTTAASGQITTITVGHNLTGHVNVSGALGSMSVGTTTAVDKLDGNVTVGGSLGALTVTGDVSGNVTVSGNFTTGNVSGNVSGTVNVTGTLTTLNVGGNVSGTVTESGTITLLTIGGNLTSTGTINAINTTTAALGQVTTMTVGHNLDGLLKVSGDVGTLTVGTVTATDKLSGAVQVGGSLGTLTVNGDITGHVNVAGNFTTGNVTGNISGTVSVDGTLTALTVGANVSGTILEHGTTNLIDIGGSLTSTGSITATNATATTGNIVTLNLGADLAGTVLVSGALTSLTVGNNVSGVVTESGAIHDLTIHGSLLLTGTAPGVTKGTINAVNATAATGQIVTMTVDHNLAGALNVSGNVGTLNVGTGPTDDLSGTVQIGGSLGTLNVHGNVSGLVHVVGNFTTGSVTGNISGNVSVDGTLTTLTVGGNVSGTILEHGTTNLIDIGGSVSGLITATNPVATSGNINTMHVGVDISGTVLVSGALDTLTVGGNVSGTVTESGKITLLAIGGSLTSTGTINAVNATAATGQIVTMTVGQNLAGYVNVSGNLGSLTVGGDLSGHVIVGGDFNTGAVTGNVSGVINVTGTLTKLTVGGDVSGLVNEHGTIDLLTIGGSLTSTGVISATNPADPMQVPTTPQATLGNINTMTVGLNLDGHVNVTGTFTTLTVGGNLTGTVAVQGALTTLKVTGNVSGNVTESGTINLLAIGGSLISTGIVTAANSNDPAQVPAAGGATIANINTFTIGADLAGTVTVTGTVTLLTVDGNLSGTVSVHGALTTLKVTGNVSGAVTESGTIDLLTIGGSLTSTGVITAFNSVDPSQVPTTTQATIANINTMSVGANLDGHVNVSGAFTTLNVGGNLTGTVAVQGALTTLQVVGDVSGNVSESGLINLLTIGGSLTASGQITAANTNDSAQVIVGGPATLANINTFTIGANLAGMVTVTGSVTLLTVGGNLSGTVIVHGALTTLKVTGDVSGVVTESGTVALLTIGGSLTASGKITAANTADPSQLPLSGGTTVANINTFTIGVDLAGNVKVTGAVTLLTVGGNLSGTVLVQGQLTTLKVTGSVSGSVTESGTVTLLTIGGSLTGTITAKNTQDSAQVPPSGQVTLANITTLTIGHNLSGTLTVSGNVVDFTVGTTLADSLSGTVTIGNTLTNLAVTGDVSGSVAESGKILTLTIGGSLTSTGKITASNTNDPAQLPSPAVPTYANIVTMSVAQNLAGQVKVTGNVTTLTVGGDLSGIVFVQGTLTTLKVTGNVSGAVTESGTINLLTIGGSLTSTGTIRAFNNADPSQLPPVDPPWLGNIVLMTVGANLAGQVTVSGDFNTLTVGGNLSGSVLVQNTLTTVSVTGDVSGSVIESGTINSFSIGGSLTSTGLIKAVNIVPTLGNIVTFTIGRDFAGTVIVSGNLHSLAIVGGSMTPTGRLTVGSLDTMTIGPDQLSVGQNMAGIITVLGTLQTLRVAGGTPGTIIAGHIGTISVYGGFGPVVLNVTENGIQRKIELTTPGNPYPQPDPTTVAGSPYVNLQFFYESGSLANPQVTARLNNGIGTARSQYDLSFITYNNTAKFNLARLDAVGTSGVRNVVIEGDLLTAVTAQAAAFFHSTPTAMPAGVRLPVDDIAGVSIRDYAPNGYIQARTIMAIAFGSHTDPNGRLETGANAAAGEAERLLTPDTKIVQSADTFRVAFADQPNFAVGLFFAVRTTGGNGSFEAHVVALTVQSVVTANAAGTGNIVTPSNVARGAATALVTAMPTYDKDGKIRDSVIQTIAIRGDGASIATKEYVSQAITSTGPLGDITLTSDQGITDITAPSIFGSIDGKKITGTVQTTGLRTNPINSTVTTVNADLGRVYVTFTNKGVPVITTSTIDADIEGSLIVRGTLISTITNQKVSGLLAIQGNFGVSQTFGTTTMRLGGGTINGALDGAIVVLGNQIADVTVHGGFKARTYAVGGDVLGNLSIDGGSNDNGLLLVGGKIGDATLGTTLTYGGDNKGILAAYGAIRFTKTAPKGYVFNNVGAVAGDASAAAIRAVFTNNGATLALDVTGLDLQGLSLILADLARVSVNASGKLSGPIP